MGAQIRACGRTRRLVAGRGRMRQPEALSSRRLTSVQRPRTGRRRPAVRREPRLPETATSARCRGATPAGHDIDAARSFGGELHVFGAALDADLLAVAATTYLRQI